MSVLDEVLAANKAYVAEFDARSDLALPPARQFTVLTCMDARLDPAEWFVIDHTDCDGQSCVA